MKKLLTALLLLIVLITPIQAKAAGKTYNIDKLGVDAQILQNGDVQVHEELTYNFTGNFNGIYINLSKKGSDGFSVSDISVKNKDNKVVQLTHSGSSENNTYQILDADDKTQLKMFVKSSNEVKTFILNYTIHEAAVKSDNYGELNWNFYTVENNIPVRNVDLNLSLKSSSFDLDQFKYWSYVDGKDFTTNYDANGIHIKGKELTSLLGIKVHFQQSYLNIAVNEDSSSSSGALIPTILIAIVVGFLMYSHYKKNKDLIKALNKYRAEYKFFDGKLLTSAPREFPPALLNLLCFEKCSNTLPSTLLYLSQKGYYKMNETSYTLADQNENYENDVIFIRNRKAGLPSSPHLQYVIEWMSGYEKNNSFSLRSIEEDVNSRDNASMFNEKLSEWKDIINEEANALGFYEKIEGDSVLSNEYYDMQLRWTAYKKYLLEQINSEQSNLTVDNINDLLIYSSVLDIGSDYLESFSNKLKQISSAYKNNEFDFWTYYMLTTYNNRIWNNIDNNIYDNTSSSDNFGGFSSGSGFSGGGGGGSGAF